MKASNSIIAKNIRERRIMHGMDSKDLAKAAGVTPGAISNIQSGARIGSLDTILRIARALDTTVEELATETPCMHAELIAIPNHTWIHKCVYCDERFVTSPVSKPRDRKDQP